MTWQADILWEAFKREKWLAFVKEAANGEVTVGVTDLSDVPVKINAMASTYKIKLKIELAETPIAV